MRLPLSSAKGRLAPFLPHDGSRIVPPCSLPFVVAVHLEPVIHREGIVPPRGRPARAITTIETRSTGSAEASKEAPVGF